MNIGQFTKNESGFIVGSIVSPFGTLKGVSFEPITAKGNGPNYILTIDGGELGAAWSKTSAKGNEYHSVSIRSPFLPASVNCALLESTRTPGTFALVWDEPKKDDAQG
ncbi:DUF736 family protein [Novosphingobium sp. FKTRR1]|uniref:DUF736 domain-containing protein n=1 Tax=Novosphingobium sp. FKTRR1 TaxID=2879118 RepID=UPI001CF0BA7B|nr:DUF736 family protein [Novosphingobium sp. FKTRR1]